MHACVGRYKRSNCLNKFNNIWACTDHVNIGPICCAPPEKEGDQEIPRCHFQNNQNFISSMALLQNKSLFPVLRVDLPTLVFP